MKNMDDPFPEALTAQEEQVAAAYVVTGGDLQKTADATGLKSKQAVSAMVRKPIMRAYLATFLDEAGATLESAAKVIADAQQAKDTKLFSYEGRVTDTVELVDHKTRLDAAKMNLQARGQLKDGANVQVSIYASLTDEQLAQIAVGAAAPEEFIETEAH